jgi:acetylornithine/N-succinyldiaminopimelate aminotransferase
MSTESTISVEDAVAVPFFKKIPISIERGKGVYVWTEEGTRLMDFTAGWGVTCLGHTHPVIIQALREQSETIMQNPNSGLTYSPARARLLSLMRQILPANLTRVFFSNSGAEANDAAIKLARKVTGRPGVVSCEQGFHGRTVGTLSATGQAAHRERFNVLVPHHAFVPYDDIPALKKSLTSHVAAVIIEPIQGEGGVQIPSKGCLEEVHGLCKGNGSLLIVDEIQTGFCRTGPMFAIESSPGVRPDFLTMAKGIAGGFPLGAFAISEEVSGRIETGDHGGTYSGNPLGCAVAYAVIKYLIDNRIGEGVTAKGRIIREELDRWRESHPELIVDVRGRGLLLAIEFKEERMAASIADHCLAHGLIVRQTQGRMIRLFPSLTITESEIAEGLAILHQAVRALRAERLAPSARGMGSNLYRLLKNSPFPS